MKLNDLITLVQRKFVRVRSLLRYNPLSDSGRRNIIDAGVYRGQKRLRELEIPQPNSSAANHSAKVVDRASNYTFEPPTNPYPQYDRCDRHNPLGCDRPLATLRTAPMAKFCSRCGFPAPLPPQKEIRGKKGIYQIVGFRSRQNNGRIYDAVQQNNGREVIIKEYLLPRRYFQSTEIREQKKEIFTRVTNFQVAESIPSDFRLIIPREGIADRDRDSCYLIAPDNLAALPNLKTYLAERGRMETEQVLQLLEQVLQSLEFLHSHKWKFTSGEIKQGIVHGNLSLDTLLIKQTEVEFLVYLWDLSVWEQLFLPNSTAREDRVSDDLVALGNIGLYLLAAPEIVTRASYPLDPHQKSNWRGIAPPLQSFLGKLLGINSRFNDAMTARRELRKLKADRAKLELTPATPAETLTTTKKNSRWLFWTLFSLLFIFLAGGIWWWKRNPNPQQTIAFSGKKAIEDISNVPPGDFTYGIVASEKLESLFKINNTYKNAYGLAADVNSFVEILAEKQKITLNQQIFNERQELINNISPRQTNFALVNFSDRQNSKFSRPDGEEIINNPLAYDGLLVYVAFVDCSRRCEQLGEYLEQKITVEQLRQIYTARVTNWQEIAPNIPDNISLQVFAPQDDFALQLFEQLLFGEQEEDIQAFRAAIAAGKIQQRESFPMLQQIRNLWQQEKTGGIGFDFQSIIYKQCNAYPLSVVRDNSDFFPMLIKQNQTGVELFDNLSCKDKQDYQLNQTVFRDRRYPLAFSLNLLYLNDDRSQNLELGEKLTEIFQTQEFQCHLSHKKLIPLELNEKDCKR